MSKLIASAAIRGAKQLVKQAEEMVEKAIADKGKDFKFEFPDTAFHLTMIYAMTAFPVKTLGDMKVALGFAKELLHDDPVDKVWKPYLGEALDSGMATLFAEEIILRRPRRKSASTWSLPGIKRSGCATASKEWVTMYPV